HGMRLGKEFLEQIVLHECRLAARTWLALKPPDAVIVGRAADDVCLAAAGHVVSKHVGTGRAELGWMEFPGRLAVGFGRLLPPSGGRDHIEPAGALDVADTETMSKLERAWNILTGFTDRVHLPRLGRILARREPAHLSLLIGKLSPHDQDAF